MKYSANTSSKKLFYQNILPCSALCSPLHQGGGGGWWVVGVGATKCGVGNILDREGRDSGGGRGGVTLQLHFTGWSLSTNSNVSRGERRVVTLFRTHQI